MKHRNDTQVSEFLLLGLSEGPKLQSFLFGLFLSMYLVSGNLLIILATITDSHLHMPNFLFLSNLSLCDICLYSTTVLKMPVNLQMQNRVITYEVYLMQMYFFLLFTRLEVFLLAAMAYDRFMAVCHLICALLVLGTWIMWTLNSLLQSSVVLWLPFGTQLEIPYFSCELNQMVQHASSDTFFNVIVTYFEAGVLGGGPLAGVLYSFFKIVSSIHAISSSWKKYKAFSTYASHLSMVSLFYCMSIRVYLSSAVPQNTHLSTAALVMYTVVSPMLNPFIYSLRNKDIKGALKILPGWKI